MNINAKKSPWQKKVYKKCTKSVCSRSVLPPLPPEPLWVGDHLAQAPAGHPLPAGTALHSNILIGHYLDH